MSMYVHVEAETDTHMLGITLETLSFETGSLSALEVAVDCSGLAVGCWPVPEAFCSTFLHDELSPKLCYLF